MWMWSRKKPTQEQIDKWRCASHLDVMKKLARIEGENLIIILILTIILTIVIERLA